MLTSRTKSYDQPRQHVKKQRHCFADKIHLVEAMVFPVVRYGCENWTINKAECQSIDALFFCLFFFFFLELIVWAVMLKKTLESPLDCKEIQPFNPQGNQSWISIGRTDPEAETPILWPPDGKNWLIWKDPDAGKDWRCEEEGMTEDEMVGWHHWLDGHDFEQALGIGDGQGGLACCSPWGCKSETQQSNWTELFVF